MGIACRANKHFFYSEIISIFKSSLSSYNLKLFLTIITFLAVQNTLWSQSLDSITKVLETKMNSHDAYDLQKEVRIKALSVQSESTKDRTEIYKINNEIFEEYQYYSFDKALQFIEKNIEIAEELKDDLLENEAILKMGLLLVNTGRFKESIDALSEIDRNAIPESLINDYFLAYEEGYSGLAYTTTVNRSQQQYSELYTAYKDSLYNRIKPNTEAALRIKEKEFRDNRNLDLAFNISTQRLENVEMGSRGFSLVTFERSLLYELNGESAKQKEYLILSAISDIQASVKDNASMGTLAKILFTEGDIDRAHKYINFSYDDAEFFNSQLRFVDIANNMPLITKAYEQKNAKQKSKLQKSLIFISILATFLLIAVYLIFKQVKKVSIARNNLKTANEKL